MKILDFKRTALISCFFLFWSSAQPMYAQRRSASEAGTPAGGTWMMYSSEDPMTAAKKVRFELEADKLMEDSDTKAKIVLYCVNGKLSLGDFRPNLKLGPPNRPSFWEGRPQMRVLVRINDSHDHHNWNWVNGHFLAIDKDTVRQIIGARLLRIQFDTPHGPEIAEFSPAGLDLAMVKNACGLKPQKP